MLKASDQTDKEVCEQADKLVVQDYFENNADPNADLKIEDQAEAEGTVIIEPQEENEDCAELEEEQEDTGLVYSSQNIRPRQLLT